MRSISLLIAFILIVVPYAADADLIDNGDTTTDTNTGLEWLDISLTGGVSINDIVLGNFGGYTTSGFVHATGAQVFELWANIEDPLFTAYSDPTLAYGIFLTPNAAAPFIELFGTAGGDPGLSGWFVDSFEDEILGVGCVTAATPGSVCNLPGNYWWLESFFGSLDAASPRVGHWMIRDNSFAVPEPGTLALLGIGIAGMALSRRRRQSATLWGRTTISFENLA